MINANIKCRSLTRRKIKMKGRHIHVTHNKETKIIVILTIKNLIEKNKMNNIDNTKNNNNDDYNNNETIIIMIVIIKIIAIIIIITTP